MLIYLFQEYILLFSTPLVILTSLLSVKEYHAPLTPCISARQSVLRF